MSGPVRSHVSRGARRAIAAPREPPGGGEREERSEAVYRETPPAHLYLRFFPAGEVDTIAALVDEVAARKDAFIEQWKDLYASSFGAHLGCSEALFRDTYVPHLRSAVLRLAGGDSEGFVQFAALLGEQLADGGTPFAVLVAHLNLLKQSCVRLVAGPSGAVGHGLLHTVDKMTACCISAAADSYYRRLISSPREAASAERAAPALPNAWVFHGMVGRSEVMDRVFDQVRRSAYAAAPVLIIGETGTGKELISRAIHACGPRHRGPFVAVNCAALPRELIESELFGYARGAFSGATADHLGLFRAASGGTLLLDEITEMSAELQAKLLRVLQERTVRPVGSITEVPIDARIIASTNRDPSAAVASGVLRSDLYYRLCVGVINVPPLRQRRDDIVPLVEHQLALLNERHAGTVPGVRGITAAAMTALESRQWPGNVRELFNVLEQAFTSSRALHVGLPDLPPAPNQAPAPSHEGAGLQTFAASERDLIQRALASTRGNKLHAARLLGISRKTLYAKIAKYALPAV